VSRDICEKQRVMNSLGAKVSNQVTVFQLMRLQKFGFVGIDGLFTRKASLFGAHCSSQDLLVLRFSFPKRKMRKELRILFKSETFKQVQRRSE
jgi:hypothetical protein